MHVPAYWRAAIAAAVIPFFVIACDQSQGPSASNQHAAAGDAESSNISYDIVTDIQQTMEWFLDPAADVIWDSAGTIITAQGRQELTPDTDDGWDTVLHAAATLAETGNLLMMPGRSAGDDWNEYSRGLVAAGKLAMEAAQAKDGDALFDAGGRIYQVCKACHNQYWIKDADESLP